MDAEPTMRLNPDPRMRRWSVVTTFHKTLSVCNTYDTLDRALVEVAQRACENDVTKLEVCPSW